MTAHVIVPKYNVGVETLNYNAGFVGKIVSFFVAVKTGLEKRATEKRTYRELQALSNHELSDIGISRSDIMAVSKGIFNS